MSACLTRGRPRAHITRTHAPRSCGAPQWTLLHYALYYGCLDAAGMLLEAGADPSVTDAVRAAWRSARVARGLRVRAGSHRSCMRGAVRLHATRVVPEEWKDGVRRVVCESRPRARARRSNDCVCTMVHARVRVGRAVHRTSAWPPPPPAPRPRRRHRRCGSAAPARVGAPVCVTSMWCTLCACARACVHARAHTCQSGVRRTVSRVHWFDD